MKSALLLSKIDMSQLADAFNEMDKELAKERAKSKKLEEALAARSK